MIPAGVKLQAIWPQGPCSFSLGFIAPAPHSQENQTLDQLQLYLVPLPTSYSRHLALKKYLLNGWIYANQNFQCRSFSLSFSFMGICTSSPECSTMITRTYNNINSLFIIFSSSLQLNNHLPRSPNWKLGSSFFSFLYLTFFFFWSIHPKLNSKDFSNHQLRAFVFSFLNNGGSHLMASKFTAFFFFFLPNLFL